MTRRRQSERQEPRHPNGDGANRLAASERYFGCQLGRNETPQ